MTQELTTESGCGVHICDNSITQDAEAVLSWVSGKPLEQSETQPQKFNKEKQFIWWRCLYIHVGGSRVG